MEKNKVGDGDIEFGGGGWGEWLLLKLGGYKVI